MTVAPAYLVVGIKDPGRSSRANRYTGASEREHLWMVEFISANILGIGFRMWFEAEAQARHFSLWELFQPDGVMNGMGPDVGLIAGDPYQVWGTGVTNRYTDTPQRMQVWAVPFMSNGPMPNMEVKYPDERDARRFSRGRAYKKADIFGTLQSAPNDNPPMQIAILQAQQAQKNAEAAADASRQADIDAARQAEVALEADYAAKIQAAKDAAAAAAAAKAAAAQAAAAAAAAKAAAAAAAAQATHQATLVTPKWWTISNGGASGWYADVDVLLPNHQLQWIPAGAANFTTTPLIAQRSVSHIRTLTGAPITINVTDYKNFQWYGVFIAEPNPSIHPVVGWQYFG